MKLTPYHHWTFNQLRKQGFAVVVVDPKGTKVQGQKADKAIIDDVFAREAGK